jgi:hypothetical protein
MMDDYTMRQPSVLTALMHHAKNRVLLELPGEMKIQIV